MYIIENGKAYLLDGEVGYLINFDTDGKMYVDKEETIDVLGKVAYTYDEMYAKLNIAYMISEMKRKNALKDFAKSEFAEYEAKIAELEKENSELKALIAELEKSDEPAKESKKTEVKEEPKVDEASEEPKVDEQPKDEEKSKKENK